MFTVFSIITIELLYLLKESLNILGIVITTRIKIYRPQYHLTLCEVTLAIGNLFDLGCFSSQTKSIKVYSSALEEIR